MKAQIESLEPAFDVRWLKAVIGADNWHFHRRLFEHYGIVLGPGEYTRLRMDVRRKRAPCIKRRSNGTAVFLVWIAPLTGPVFVAAGPSGKLLTALPDSSKLMAQVPWTRVLAPRER